MNSDCEILQRAASIPTAKKHCPRQLNKNFWEKQFLLFQKVVRSLTELHSAIRSGMLGIAFKVDHCIFSFLVRKVSILCHGRNTLAQSWPGRPEQSQSHDQAIQSRYHGCIGFFLLSLSSLGEHNTPSTPFHTNVLAAIVTENFARNTGMLSFLSSRPSLV